MTRLVPMFVAAAALVAGVSHADAKVDFEKQVQPILAKYCYSCHGEKDKSDLVLHTKAGIVKGGEYHAEDGLKTLVPGDPEKSMLYVLTTNEDRALDAGIDFMPTKGDGLTDAEKELLKTWIAEGADFGNWTESAVESGDPKIQLPEVDPADAKAVDRLTQAGALAMPLARDTNLLNVDFRAVADQIGDSHLELLKPVAKQVYWLGLARTKVTDSGLAHLKDLVNLNRLHLENTAVTDAGLAHLGGLTNLEYLNLYGTKVTDAGLIHLARLEKLQSLYLWQTGVTDKGVETLQKLLPNCKIDTGYKPKPAEPAKPADAQANAKPINAVCPVSGKGIDAAQFVVYEGQKVAFCCGNCKAKFEKDAKPFVGKIENFKPAGDKQTDAGKPINTKCPISGKAGSPDAVFVYKGQSICFCCNNCKGKFESNPEQFIAKVENFKK